jgi:hypothetical protein
MEETNKIKHFRDLEMYQGLKKQSKPARIQDKEDEQAAARFDG